jgi:DNA-binding GntR family transcriptional regulator
MTSAQDRVYAWLKSHIATVPRSEGVFLSEGQLAAEAGASRTPVREALLRLEAEGFLSIVPKKGAFVPPITDADLEALMEARALVEDWAMRRVADVGEGLSVELERILKEQADLIDDPVAFIECDRQFHRTIVAAAGNPVLLDFYESLRDRHVRMGIQAVTSTSERTRQVLREHHAIADALSSGNVDEFTRSVNTHLANTLDTLRQTPPRRSWASEAMRSGDQT